MVDPISRPRFFVVDTGGWPRFGAIVGLAVDLGRADGLAIDGAVSTELDVAVGFSGLSLW